MGTSNSVEGFRAYSISHTSYSLFILFAPIWIPVTSAPTILPLRVVWSGCLITSCAKNKRYAQENVTFSGQFPFWAIQFRTCRRVKLESIHSMLECCRMLVEIWLRAELQTVPPWNSGLLWMNINGAFKLNWNCQQRLKNQPCGKTYHFASANCPHECRNGPFACEQQSFHSNRDYSQPLFLAARWMKNKTKKFVPNEN